MARHSYLRLPVSRGIMWHGRRRYNQSASAPEREKETSASTRTTNLRLYHCEITSSSLEPICPLLLVRPDHIHPTAVVSHYPGVTEEPFDNFSVGGLEKLWEFQRKNPDTPSDYQVTKI